MPVEFLTDDEAAAYGRYARTPSQADLERVFFLDDPDRLAFELHAILLAADTKFVLHDNPTVLDLARQVVHQRLGLGNGKNAGES